MFYAIFAIYADEHFDNYYFFLHLLHIFFTKTEIIMTLFVQGKAKVNAKRYVELCYPD